MKLFYLLLLFTAPNISFAQKNPCSTDIQNFDYKSAPQDTTITLPNGTELTFNRCEFFDIRDCIEYHEIRTLEDAQQNNLTTQDSSGNPLLTGGMITVSFQSADCGKSRLEVPVRIRIPLLDNKCAMKDPNFNLYEANTAGNWKLTGTPSRVVTINGKKYLEFFTSTGGKFNADTPLPAIKIKFKSKNGILLDSVRLSAGCPVISFKFGRNKRKHIVRGKIYCANPYSIKVEIKGTKDGKEYIDSMPLSALKAKYKKTKCAFRSGKIIRNFLGLFPVREGALYGKYIIN